MLYVSSYDAQIGRYCVVDTDDNTQTRLTREQLDSAMAKLSRVGITIHGIGTVTAPITGVSSSASPVGSREDLMNRFVEQARDWGILGWYVFDADRATLLEYNGKGLDVVIPPVKTIAPECFSGYLQWVACDSHVKMLFPGVVQRVGRSAFSTVEGKNARLKLAPESVVDLSGLKHIGDRAFFGADFSCAKCKWPRGTVDIGKLAFGEATFK